MRELGAHAAERYGGRSRDVDLDVDSDGGLTLSRDLFSPASGSGPAEQMDDGMAAQQQQHRQHAHAHTAELEGQAASAEQRHGAGADDTAVELRQCIHAWSEDQDDGPPALEERKPTGASEEGLEAVPAASGSLAPAPASLEVRFES